MNMVELFLVENSEYMNILTGHYININMATLFSLESTSSVLQTEMDTELYE